MIRQVQLPGRWVSAILLDHLLLQGGNPLVPWVDGVEFRISPGCSLLLDAVIRLLAYANQMSAAGRRVHLVFEAGRQGTMGYLDRMGFFDHLDERVEVDPGRPLVSGADAYRGANGGLVEIAAIRRGALDLDLPGELTDTLKNACAGRPDAAGLGEAAFTIFSELIGNVHDHSDTVLDGFVALQVYQRGNKVAVVVSDSGRGLVQTLRPELERREPRYAQVDDVNLLVELFQDGLSRHADTKHGHGLSDCAGKAIRFGAGLEVRLAMQNVRLVPSGASYRPTPVNMAYTTTGLTHIAGTHIAFDFKLAP